jgi:hypothetical protein
MIREKSGINLEVGGKVWEFIWSGKIGFTRSLKLAITAPQHVIIGICPKIMVSFLDFLTF